MRRVVQVYESSPPGSLPRQEALRVLAAFAYVFRSVDDLGAVTHDPECFAEYLPRSFQRHGICGLYPDTLVLTDTSVAGGRRAHYMDLHIHRPARSIAFSYRRLW